MRNQETFWVYDLAMHIANGRKYRGRRVKKGAVVYIATEGARGLLARSEAFRQAFLDENEDPPFYLLTTRLTLESDVKRLIADLHAQLGDVCPVCIVIDTLNRSIDGSENDPEDMGGFVRGCDALREAFHASVVVIHHCGTEEKRPRGHTSLTGAADVQIAVKRDAAQNVVAKVEYSKDDGSEGDTFISGLDRVVIGQDEDGDDITSCVVEPLDEAPPPAGASGPHLSDRLRVALDTLEKAIGAHGEPAPAHNYIPASARIVQLDIWRRFYLQDTSSDGQEIDTRRKAWRRAVDGL